MILWHCLSEEEKEEWAKHYKKRFGKEFIPPKRDKRAIHCEVKIEEINQIKQTELNYPLDVQGREG